MRNAKTKRKEQTAAKLPAVRGLPVSPCNDRSEFEYLARSTIDEINDHIAIIDELGTILIVNEAWREFAAANGARPQDVSEGNNYLGTCSVSSSAGDTDATKVAALISEVANGSRGAVSFEYPCHSPTEERWFSMRVRRFVGSGPARMAIIHRNVTERVRSERQIAHLATHDLLTGLPNRLLLEDRALQALDRAKTNRHGLALLFLDLDNFKYLNDAYGHAVGDEILASFALELRAGLGSEYTIARFGGDEFVLLLTDLENPAHEAAKVARSLLRSFEFPLPLGDREVSVTTSIGISLYPHDGTSVHDLLRHAEEAMYRAKRDGGSSFYFYSVDMSARAAERVLVEAELRRALRREQFGLYYQPQILIGTNQIIGMEALIRWPHPELGMMPPDRFIPVAEETGLIGPIGRKVLEAACIQNKAWQTAGYTLLPVGVNISATQLKDQNFVRLIKEVLSESGLDPHFLELEITERMMIERSTPIIDRLQELKDFGITLSIDDFGTGYSNLATLKSFPFDRLKIDRSFIEELPDGADAQSIVRAVVAMCDSLGLRVIAEGVETAAQASFLHTIGCKEAQGFFYAKPLTASEMEGKLHQMGLFSAFGEQRVRLCNGTDDKVLVFDEQISGRR